MFCINILAKRINKLQMTNENYRPNFKGAFLINYKKALPETRKCLEELIGPHKRQIFDAFSGKDKQVMYVMKNSKDYDVAHFVIKNDLNFKYYPEVSTKFQFEPDKPQDVISYIKTQHPKLIQKPYELLEYIKAHRENCRAQKDSHLSIADKILNVLCYDKNAGKKEKLSNASVVFIDKNTGDRVVISPKSALGTRFVCVTPKRDYEEIKRLAFDENGNILKTFLPPDGIKLFNQQFKNAIKEQCKQ